MQGSDNWTTLTGRKLLPNSVFFYNKNSLITHQLYKWDNFVRTSDEWVFFSIQNIQHKAEMVHCLTIP